jgi:hypothetical protein
MINDIRLLSPQCRQLVCRAMSSHIVLTAIRLKLKRLPMLCFGFGALLTLCGDWIVIVGLETDNTIKTLHLVDPQTSGPITSGALRFQVTKAEKRYSGSKYMLMVSDEESSVPNDENALHWDFKNLTGRRIQLQFFSQDRSHVWPGNDQAWNLRDDQVYTYDLSCEASETICYGAWYYDGTNRHWGAGRRGDEACTKCCARCGGSPEQVDLAP